MNAQLRLVTNVVAQHSHWSSLPLGLMTGLLKSKTTSSCLETSEVFGNSMSHSWILATLNWVADCWYGPLELGDPPAVAFEGVGNDCELEDSGVVDPHAACFEYSAPKHSSLWQNAVIFHNESKHLYENCLCLCHSLSHMTSHLFCLCPRSWTCPWNRTFHRSLTSIFLFLFLSADLSADSLFLRLYLSFHLHGFYQSPLEQLYWNLLQRKEDQPVHGWTWNWIW